MTESTSNPNHEFHAAAAVGASPGFGSVDARQIAAFPEIESGRGGLVVVGLVVIGALMTTVTLLGWLLF